VASSRPESKDEESVGAGTPPALGYRYGKLKGSLLCIVNTTRPDIAHAVGVVSRYRMSRITSHWNEAMKPVLNYHRDT
jgi:hypothetical protein